MERTALAAQVAPTVMLEPPAARLVRRTPFRIKARPVVSPVMSGLQDSPIVRQNRVSRTIRILILLLKAAITRVMQLENVQPSQLRILRP